MIALKMAEDSGSPRKRPLARCTGCESHPFVEITAVRLEYSDWIVWMKCHGRW